MPGRARGSFGRSFRDEGLALEHVGIDRDAAVALEAGASDEGGPIRGQPDHRLGDLFGISEALERLASSKS